MDIKELEELVNDDKRLASNINIFLEMNGRDALDAFTYAGEIGLKKVKKHWNFKGTIELLFTETFLVVLGRTEQVDKFKYYIGVEDDNNTVSELMILNYKVCILAEGNALKTIDMLLQLEE